MQIIFLPISKPSEKLQAIVGISNKYFLKHTHLLIKCKNEQIATFLDEQLWLLPKHGFLPHIISDEPSNELIVLTTSNQNTNQAHSIFNLTKQPLDLSDKSIMKIYELEDTSSEEEIKRTRALYTHYKHLGCRIQAMPLMNILE